LLMLSQRVQAATLGCSGRTTAPETMQIWRQSHIKHHTSHVTRHTSHVTRLSDT
jgi:hypothetical protein